MALRPHPPSANDPMVAISRQKRRRRRGYVTALCALICCLAQSGHAHLLDEVAASLLCDIETTDRMFLKATWYVQAGHIEAYFDAAEQIGDAPQRSAAAFAARLAEGFVVPGCVATAGAVPEVAAPERTGYRAFRVDIRCPTPLESLTLRRVAYSRQKTRATLYISLRVAEAAPRRLLLPPRLAQVEVALNGGRSTAVQRHRAADDPLSDDAQATKEGYLDASSAPASPMPRPGDTVDLASLPPVGSGGDAGLRPPPWPILRGWTLEGARHMALGWDHLLFVFGLVLSARRLRALFVAVAAFSLSHLATMTLAIVHAWPRFAAVEVVIGATIIAAAYASIRARPPTATTLAALAACAGLVHGAAFGADLRGVLATSDGLLWPVVAFGVGLDAAQSVFALAMAAALAGLRRQLQPQGRHRLRAGLGVALALAGAAFAVAGLVGK